MFFKAFIFFDITFRLKTALCQEGNPTDDRSKLCKIIKFESSSSIIMSSKSPKAYPSFRKNRLARSPHRKNPHNNFPFIILVIVNPAFLNALLGIFSCSIYAKSCNINPDLILLNPFLI